MAEKSSYQLRKEELAKLKTDLALAQSKITEITNVADKKRPEEARIVNNMPLVYTNQRTLQDISTWRSALISAENVQYPNRLMLYKLYKDVMIDAQVSSAIQSRKAAILGADFIVMGPNGKEDLEKTKLLNKKYFYDFLSLAIDSIFFGFSLIQFDDLEKDIFTNIRLIPREYVVPELGIFTRVPSSLEGPSFLDEPWKEWSIGVGEATNLGLLAKLAPYTIWKKNAISSWAEYTTVFGTPTRILHSDNHDPIERQRSENFLRNMASSCYAILPKDDILEFMEPNNAGGAESLFNGLITKCDEQISKIILGQVSTMDSKNYVGSANVHRKQQDRVFESDKQWIEQVLEMQFIPFINDFGFGFDGCRIELKNDESLDMNEKLAVINGLMLNFDVPLEYVQEVFNIQVKPKGTIYAIEQNPMPFAKVDENSKPEVKSNNAIISTGNKPNSAEETPKGQLKKNGTDLKNEKKSITRSERIKNFYKKK